MDVATLEQLLREAELRRQGRDAADARACLRRLESSQARHMAERNRPFQDLADRSRLRCGATTTAG